MMKNRSEFPDGFFYVKRLDSDFEIVLKHSWGKNRGWSNSSDSSYLEALICYL